MTDDFPEKWIPATEMFPTNEGVSVFNQDGVRYITEGERTDSWLWMEEIPPHMENRC